MYVMTGPALESAWRLPAKVERQTLVRHGPAEGTSVQLKLEQRSLRSVLLAELDSCVQVWKSMLTGPFVQGKFKTSPALTLATAA